MPQHLPPYHIAEQRADALIRPLAVATGDLAERATHYLDRLSVTDDDRAALAAAQSALAAAHAELDRLWRARLATPRQ